jgi:RNA polymerase sigma-70 factor (ECF subfamily)
VREPRPETSSLHPAPAGYPHPTAPAASTTRDALETFVFEHYGRLIRLAALVCRSVDEAEDAVQSALERAWRRRDALRDPASLRPWLDRIVVREAIRTKKRRLTTADELVLDRHGAESTDAIVALRIAFQQLSADHRAAVILHIYMGYSVAATAHMLGARLETVRSRLRFARERLRHLLAEEG